MEEGSDYRQWDQLIPDLLGLIFRNLLLQERLTVIPRVCKSWCKAVMGPYCWQEIDIEEWSKRCQPEHLDPMLQMLITRSCGSLRKLCVSGLHGNTIFTFIAENAGSLQTLRLQRSEMTNPIVEQIAGRLSALTFLDVSYCGNIGARALEAIGKNCKLLGGLCRKLHPVDTAGKPLQDDEAYAIATTMPKLKHLEMAYHLISTASVVEILSSCPELKLLDLRGCCYVKLDDNFLEDNFPNLKVLGPIVNSYYEGNESDDCSDSSDGSEYLAWQFVAGGNMEYIYEDYDDYDSYYGVWDDERSLEELELTFYEANEDAGAYVWPPSP